MICLFIEGGASASSQDESGAAVATEAGGQVSKKETSSLALQ